MRFWIVVAIEPCIACCLTMYSSRSRKYGESWRAAASAASRSTRASFAILRPSRPRTLRTALFHPPAPASASTEEMA